MKIIEIIEKVQNFHGKLENPRFDKVIWGDVDKECTGIAVCCSPTVDVIKKAHEIGANLLICHEPAFYTGRDDMSLVEGVKLVEEKIGLIDEYGITIWRDHDHMHGGRPTDGRERRDYIFYGIMKTLGWEEYVIGNTNKPLLYEIPETDVPSLCRFLMDRLHLNGVRIVGDKNAKVHRVFFCEHVMERHDEEFYTSEEVLNSDVFIPLEIIDWTLASYIRDAAFLGQGKAILEMGHFNVEEAGMEHMAKCWLPKLLENAVPVTFVQSGDSFEYVVR